MRKHIAAVAVVGLLAGCSAAQMQSVSADITAACQIAMPLAAATAAIPNFGPFVSAGVQVGCGSASGLAKLAADPSSAAWLGQQIQMMKDALGQK